MTVTSPTVSRITAALGLIILLALVVSAALPVAGHVMAGHTPASGTQVASLEGVETIRVNSQDSRVTVAFGDVSEPELTSTDPDTYWTWRTSGTTLSATNGRPFGGMCFYWCGPRDEQITVTLPAQAQGMLAGEFNLSSGALTVAGDFITVEAEVSAGSLHYTGTTSELALDLTAGSADVEATGVNRAEFEVAAGRVNSELRGTTPQTVTIEATAGELDLILPDEPYDVSTDLTFGDFTNLLDTRAGAPNAIYVEMVAGRVALHPGE